MAYWLMKSEPEAFSIDDLRARQKKTEHWDGVRNYQARNMLRDQFKKGDLAFFYHSNCQVPGIAGVVEVVKAGYPDFTAFNPDSKYFDPKSNPDKPRWFMVDIKFKEKFVSIIPLEILKTILALKNMQVLRKGNRLSITPVSTKEWQTIYRLAKK